MPQRATKPGIASHEDILALALTLFSAAAVVLLHIITYTLHLGW